MGLKEKGDSPLFQPDLFSGEAGSGDDSAPRIRLSARARRLSIRVYPDARVVVVVPPRARPADVETFLGAHRAWIDAKRAQALANRPAPEPFPPPHVDLQATGERFRVHVAGGAGRLRLSESPGLLTVTGEGTHAGLRRLLREWLVRAALERLEPRVASIAQANGIRFARVSLRRQRSRWGSCSVRGTISLNACLLFQRPAVVDYLIVHELTHVRHMNHSARFWQSVESVCPDWRALDRELLRGWRTVPRWVFSDH
jgi:predicted metal-dependent hydrolase